MQEHKKKNMYKVLLEERNGSRMGSIPLSKEKAYDFIKRSPFPSRLTKTTITEMTTGKVTRTTKGQARLLLSPYGRL